MPATRRNAGAFTLIEALATLTIMAIVLPVALQAISTATSVASTALQRTQAVMLCESKLHELVATRGWEESELEGEFTPEQIAGSSAASAAATTSDETKFKWAAELVGWLDDRVEQLNVTVTWERNGQERSVTLSTLVRVEEQ